MLIRMSKVTFTFLLLFFTQVIFSNFAHAQYDPWPWAEALPLDWDNLNGLWEAESKCTTEKMLYSLKVLKMTSTEKQVEIIQLNPETLEIIAQGKALEKGKVLKGYILGITSVDYTVKIGYFKVGQGRKGKKTLGLRMTAPIGENGALPECAKQDRLGKNWFIEFMLTNKSGEPISSNKKNQQN